MTNPELMIELFVASYILACYLSFLEVIKLKSHYGHQARILHWCTDQALTRALEEMELTSAQGHIMGYLAARKEPPCPKDIEEAFHLSHPTVSGLLSRLEKKGFLEMRTDEKDRRCKRIYVLPKGMECNDRIWQTILNIEQQLVAGFTDAEQNQFEALLDRAIANMGGYPHPKPDKPNEEETK